MGWFAANLLPDEDGIDREIRTEPHSGVDNETQTELHSSLGVESATMTDSGRGTDTETQTEPHSSSRGVEFAAQTDSGLGIDSEAQTVERAAVNDTDSIDDVSPVREVADRFTQTVTRRSTWAVLTKVAYVSIEPEMDSSCGNSFIRVGDETSEDDADDSMPLLGSKPYQRPYRTSYLVLIAGVLLLICAQGVLFYKFDHDFQQLSEAVDRNDNEITACRASDTKTTKLV